MSTIASSRNQHRRRDQVLLGAISRLASASSSFAPRRPIMCILVWSRFATRAQMVLLEHSQHTELVSFAIVSYVLSRSPARVQPRDGYRESRGCICGGQSPTPPFRRTIVNSSRPMQLLDCSLSSRQGSRRCRRPTSHSTIDHCRWPGASGCQRYAWLRVRARACSAG